MSDPKSQTHLQRFWKLLKFKQLAQNNEDINTIIQVAMMKYQNRAPICKIHPIHLEKCLTRIFVKETQYYCNRSRLLIKGTEMRKIIDMLLEEGLQWYIETTREGFNYIFADWQHWNL